MSIYMYIHVSFFAPYSLSLLFLSLLSLSSPSLSLPSSPFLPLPPLPSPSPSSPFSLLSLLPFPPPPLSLSAARKDATVMDQVESHTKLLLALFRTGWTSEVDTNIRHRWCQVRIYSCIVQNCSNFGLNLP